MIKPYDVFYEMPCLTEHSRVLPGINLQKQWFKKSDKRVLGQYLQKFIHYNSNQFAFLGVTPSIEGSDQRIGLSFKSSRHIGSIPLRAPDTGKQIGDFVVTPRYVGKNRYEEYIEILDLLGSDISPVIADSIPLASGRNFRPPLYLEAIKFIKDLELLLAKHWRKFGRIENISNQPLGQVSWAKYINSEYKVENRLKYPINKNILTELHSEYAELRHVFDICKSELLSSNTPARLKNTIKSKLAHIDEQLYLLKPLPTNRIHTRASDSPTVKQCKLQANRILNFNLSDSTAWRVDFADVFEKFTQHVFREVSKQLGGKLFSNTKFFSRTIKHFTWEQKYIEPDAVYRKDDLLIFIDAKYKSNLYNKFTPSDIIKEDHRHDLHQIMAYTSFGEKIQKYGVLCYPSDSIEIKRSKFSTNINSSSNTIIIIGLPLFKDSVLEATKRLGQEFSIIQKQYA